MKAKIAVVTVSGKAYYLIVNELKRKKITFLSLTPNDFIPLEIKVVITTEEEQHLINHKKILVYTKGGELEMLINKAIQIARGKEYYEKVVIGIDPGEVFGLAVLADGRVIETENCFSVEETLNKIKKDLRNFTNPETLASVKIGDGAPAYKEKLLQELDDALPLDVILEVVSEAGTNSRINANAHRRRLRDIVSAIKIAGRNGFIFPRSKTNETTN